MSSAFINIAIKAAYAAAKIIKRKALTKFSIYEKGNNDFVTDLDIEAEKVIIDVIKSNYPDHGILSEETHKEDPKKLFTWIIDPIDGTNNFIRANPHYVISIGIRYQDQVTHGVILDPSRNDLYVAESGHGAFLNDRRIRVSKAKNIHNAVIGINSFYTNELPTHYISFINKLSSNASGIRRYGSAALELAYVATGYLDGFCETNLKPWDIAAGIVLIKEAGGLVANFNNEEGILDSGNIITANPALLDKILQLLNNKE